MHTARITNNLNVNVNVKNKKYEVQPEPNLCYHISIRFKR